MAECSFCRLPVTVHDLYDHVHLFKKAVPVFAKIMKDVILNRTGTHIRRSRTGILRPKTTERHLLGTTNSMLRRVYQPRSKQHYQQPPPPQSSGERQSHLLCTNQLQTQDHTSPQTFRTLTPTAATQTDWVRQTILCWCGQRNSRPRSHWTGSHPGHAEYIMLSSFGPQS